MLELRPTCEQCNKSLPPEATDAMICSFECTFCRDCVTTVLDNVCPNCGGGFWQRPVRPSKARVNDLSVATRPASTKIVFRPVDPAVHRAFATTLRDIPPEAR